MADLTTRKVPMDAPVIRHSGVQYSIVVPADVAMNRVRRAWVFSGRYAKRQLAHVHGDPLDNQSVVVARSAIQVLRQANRSTWAASPMLTPTL
jgi:hypothetical protein